MPIYFIHHPSGNVVIRTDNACIVLWHQHRGWLTTTSFADVLHDHPEWRPPNPHSPPLPPRALQPRRICNVLASPFRSLLTLYTSARTANTLPHPPNPAVDSNDGDGGQVPLESNSGPMHWMTALERSWYEERGLVMPLAGWIQCTEGEEAFEYRLESGKWELRGDAPPRYDVVSAKGEKDGVR